MDLRIKTFFIVTGVFAILIASASLLSSQILLKSFEEVENTRTKLSAERVKEAFTVDLDNLNTKLADWAVWDDSYFFVSNKNEEFIQKNLQPESLSLIKVNIMIFVNAHGEIVDSRYYDYNTDVGTFQPVPESLVAELSPNTPILNFDSSNTHREGIINLPEGLLMVAARPIVLSDGSGTPAGTLIFGRFLDGKQIEYLSQVTHFPLEMFLISDKNFPDDISKIKSELQNDASVAAAVINDKTIAGYVSLSDIYGNQVSIIRFQNPRDIYLLGTRSLQYFIAGLALLGLFSGVIMIVILNHLVISPITLLRNQITKIRSKGIRVQEQDFSGEFFELASEINQMLDALKLSHEQLSSALKVAHLGGWQWNLVTNSITWSDETYEICGVSKALFIPTIETIDAMIEDADRNKFQEVRKTAIEKSESFQISVRIRKPTGTVLNILIVGSPVINIDGRPTKFVGAIQEVTDLRKAEDIILKRSEELEQMNRYMVDRELRMTQLKKEVADLQKQLLEIKNAKTS